MRLRNLNLDIEYRSQYDDLINDFFIPSLSCSVEYKRAVGFFTTNSLLLLFRGIKELIKNNGTIKVIASPILTEDDVESISKGYECDTITNNLIEQLILVEDIENKAKLDVIANLIASNFLTIKIAYSKKGIYHEKIGVIIDNNDDFVSFNGSLNETGNALINNFESINVFKSWESIISTYAEKINYHFDELWGNNVIGLKVIDFPEAVREQIIRRYKISSDLESAIYNLEVVENEKNQSRIIKEEKNKYFFDTRNPYDYQIKAIDEFKKNGYRHFFEMATGTGKTFTAVQALKKLIREQDKVFVVILVPQIDIQFQWYEELQKQGLENIYALGGKLGTEDWEYDFDRSIIDYNIENTSIIYLSVFDSFFSKLISKIRKINNLAIIVDEAHNLSLNQIKLLPESAKYRLGLSATPEKHSLYETQSILNYFLDGNIKPYKYTIEEAIEAGFLSHYIYIPIFIKLSEEEFENYKDYTKKIVSLKSQEEIDEKRVNKLLTERSLIIKKSEAKIDKLKEMVLSSDYNFKNSVIYCGQGKNGDEKLIDSVTKMLYQIGKYRISTYTSQTENRKDVLLEFENGYYDTLAAIKCFDEGVDVPKLDKIYIMSSDRLLRQTIQRRGRVLRKCTESGKTIAYIYDMVALPPDGFQDIGTAKSLVKNEFLRVKEYARLADNNDELNIIVNEIENIYKITEEDYIYEK